MTKIIHYASNGTRSWLTCQGYWDTLEQVLAENKLNDTPGKGHPITRTDVARVNCPDCMENIYQLTVVYREMRQLLVTPPLKLEDE